MRLLVTGASGLLGSNLVLAALGAGHQLVATSNTRLRVIPDAEWYAADLANRERCHALIAEIEPEAVIHCAAATDVDQCEADPEQAFELNRDMARFVAEAAREIGASHVHISTDAVFDGGPGPHAETDEARPINVYGQSKLAGERAVMEVHPQASIVRTNFYGWSPPGRSSLAEWFLENLRQGIQCPGFTDVQINPLLVNELAGLLLKVLDAGHPGIYHIGCREPISKYELGVGIAQAFELDAELIQPIESQDAGLTAARPKDLSLAVEKIERDLGAPMPSVEAGVAAFRRLEQEGYPEQLGRPAPVGAQAKSTDNARSK